MKRISFQGSPSIIEVPDCPEFLGVLREVAVDWPFAETDRPGAAVACVLRRGDSYQIRSPDGDSQEMTAVGAAGSIVVDAVDGLIEANPARLCLHCASVLINGRLVVFPGHTHAGKSTLVARLAAAGHGVFGDDILLLSEDDGEGMSLGIAPRLRLPLPVGVTAAFRAFVEAHRGPADGRYQFLNLPDRLFAKRGSRAPLGAIVLLGRRPGGPARLARPSRAAALQTLAVQNFAGGASSAEMVGRLHALVEKLPLVSLGYSDLEEAAALLASAFAAWPPDLAGLPHDEEGPRLVAPGDENLLDVEAADLADLPPAGQAMIRKRDVEVRTVDGELFLGVRDGPGIYHLNPVASALWNLLAEPTSRADAVDALCLAFGSAEPGMVGDDVARTFRAMVAADLIEVVS